MHTFLQVQPCFGLKVFDACVGFQQNGVPLLQYRYSILSHISVSPKGCPPLPSWPNILQCGHWNALSSLMWSYYWFPSPFLSALGETLHMYIYYITIMPRSQWESSVGKRSWYIFTAGHVMFRTSTTRPSKSVPVLQITQEILCTATHVHYSNQAAGRLIYQTNLTKVRIFVTTLLCMNICLSDWMSIDHWHQKS